MCIYFFSPYQHTRFIRKDQNNVNLIGLNSIPRLFPLFFFISVYKFQRLSQANRYTPLSLHISFSNPRHFIYSSPPLSRPSPLLPSPWLSWQALFVCFLWRSANMSEADLLFIFNVTWNGPYFHVKYLCART